MAVNVRGRYRVQPKVPCWSKEFDVSCEDAQDNSDWILRIKWQPANPVSLGKCCYNGVCIILFLHNVDWTGLADTEENFFTSENQFP